MTTLRSTFIDAAKHNNSATVVGLLADDPSLINSIDQDHKTALFHAAWCGHLDMVKLLILHGANVNHKDNRQRSPLIAAAGYGHGDVVDCLLDHKANINDVMYKGLSALIYCVRENNSELRSYIDCINRLIQRKAALDIQDENGESALMYAEKNFEMYSLLIDAGARVDLKDNNGRNTFLRLCANASDLSCFELILTKKIDVNLLDKNQNSALDLILEKTPNLEEMKRRIILLFKAENPHFREDLKLKALTKVIAEKSKEKIALLREYGIEPKFSSAKEYLSYTTMMGEAQQLISNFEKAKLLNAPVDDEGNSLVMRMMLDRKWDLAMELAKISDGNYKNIAGLSVLQLALAQHCFDIAELLINNGANVDFDSGEAPLQLAVRYHKASLVKAIAQRTKNIDVKDKKDRTVLFNAVFEGVCDSDYVETVRALLEAGADPYIQCRSNISSCNIFDIGLGSTHFHELLTQYKKKWEAKLVQPSIIDAPHAVTFKPSAKTSEDVFTRIGKLFH